ncbi:MAG: hypothetical protein ACYTGP_11490 [Planctomycetota bacterium]|jgi:uncharacterized membrane protein
MDLPPESPVHPTEPPPAADTVALPEPGVPLTVGNAFRVGGAAFSRCFGGLVAVAFIGLAISLACEFAGAVIPFVNVVLAVVIGWPLYPGAFYVGVTAAREGRVDVADLFIGFRWYGRSLLVCLIMFAVTLTCFVPVIVSGLTLVAIGGFTGNMPWAVIVLVMGASLLLSLGATLLVTVRLMFAYGLVVDPALGELPAIQAIARSWDLTQGFTASLFGIFLLVVLIVVASVFLLCVGYPLLGAPLATAVYGAAYWLLHGTAHCRQCGYDVSATAADRCPECGGPIGAPTRYRTSA